MEKIEVSSKLVAVKVNDELLVDDSVFAKLALADRADATRALMKTGGEIKFTKSFAKFTDYRGIISNLEAGKDVRAELAFNGVDTDDTYLKAFKAYQDAIKPLIEKLNMLIPPYPFAVKPEGVKNRITFGTISVSKSNYKMKVERAKEIWDKAASLWSGNKTSIPSHYIPNGSGNYVYYTDTEVTIGCQHFPRWEVEEMAQHYGWSFPAAK